MRKRINDRNLPIGKLTRVKDFLPPPSALVLNEGTVKITIALKRSSVEFFRKEADKHHTKYQRMIRELVDQYVQQYRVD